MEGAGAVRVVKGGGEGAGACGESEEWLEARRTEDGGRTLAHSLRRAPEDGASSRAAEDAESHLEDASDRGSWRRSCGLVQVSLSVPGLMR